MDLVVIHSNPSPPIHTLDDYSLLNIFSLFRPPILDEREADSLQLLGGGRWNRERWWYRLVQVCRRWRYIVLGSTTYLRLSLVCTHGTPVADMLAHSPPIPLVIDYFDHGITAKDEEGTILALRHRDRVHRIRLRNSASKLKRLINALDGEFPKLDYLLIEPRYRRAIEHVTMNLPETFRAPHIRHLVLGNFFTSIRSQVLMSMGNLVTLSLNMTPPSTNFHPNALLQWLSLMPQLESFGIAFNNYHRIHDVERPILRMPITTRVTLPSLRSVSFEGTCTYLEALLPWVTIPLLERLQVYLINQPAYFIPHLQHFMNTAGNLRLKAAMLGFFEDHLLLMVYPHKGARTYTLDMILYGADLDWQVISAARVLRALRTEFSAVGHFTLTYKRAAISAGWSDEADCSQWRELLGSFGNVKTLHLDGNYKLVVELSRALQPGEGEPPTVVLPELQELSCSSVGATRREFTSFIDFRQKAGRPVAVIYH